MESLAALFNHPVLVIISGLLTLLVIVNTLINLYLVITGMLPVWRRLGLSLSRRKIAIFADDKYSELKDILVDSGMFKARNIIKVDRGSLHKTEDVSFYIVHYAAYKEVLNKIMAMKKDGDTLVVYAPQDEGKLDQEAVQSLNAHRNSI
ncbi:MAG: hypothetical protein R3E89_07270, partial [Thiolinea sp.]